MKYWIFQKYNDSLISKFNQKDKFQEAMNSKFLEKGQGDGHWGQKTAFQCQYMVD